MDYSTTYKNDLKDGMMYTFYDEDGAECYSGLYAGIYLERYNMLLSKGCLYTTWNSCCEYPIQVPIIDEVYNQILNEFIKTGDIDELIETALIELSDGDEVNFTNNIDTEIEYLKTLLR